MCLEALSYVGTEKHIVLREHLLTVTDPGFIGGVNSKSEATNLLFGQVFPQKCMEMKEIGSREGASLPPSDSPLINNSDSVVIG